ncbi:UNVERIFIED_CONTAM: hypothetical protein FKN15_049524 [Acipenser sinensis]
MHVCSLGPAWVIVKSGMRVQYTWEKQLLLTGKTEKSSRNILHDCDVCASPGERS